MDISSVKMQQNNIAVNTVSAQKIKTEEQGESVTDTQTNKDDSSNTPNATVTLSDSSVKLLAATPVAGANKAAPIENNTQAQASASKFVENLQNNPSSAQNVYNITPDIAKTLLAA